MIETNTNREQQKIRELVRDYTNKGYRVTALPRGKSVPAFLRKLKFSPDLIAETDDDDSLVVEVSSRESSEQLRKLGPVVDAIEKKRNWKFVLVMTNPRSQKSKRDIPASELSELQASLDSIKTLSDRPEFTATTLLSGWAILEGSIRRNLADNYLVKSIASSPRSIVRDAVTYGLLTTVDAKFLDSVAGIRNAVAHGKLDQKIPKNMVARLLKLAQSIIDDYSSPNEDA